MSTEKYGELNIDLGRQLTCVEKYLGIGIYKEYRISKLFIAMLWQNKDLK